MSVQEMFFNDNLSYLILTLDYDIMGKSLVKYNHQFCFEGCFLSMSSSFKVDALPLLSSSLCLKEW